MKISLLFPPTWHPLQPYQSLPSLTGFLAQGSVTTVSQHNLGIEILSGVASQPYKAGLYQEIKSNRRIEYAVIGDPVNVSSRLCDAAGKGEMLLSAPFRAALGFLSLLEPLPFMELKGKGQELPVFCVKR
ncbi:MAG: adenylate/guanylate cyclase domain-containing protein [Nitrospiraceae bacterium]